MRPISSRSTRELIGGAAAAAGIRPSSIPVADRGRIALPFGGASYPTDNRGIRHWMSSSRSRHLRPGNEPDGPDRAGRGLAADESSSAPPFRFSPRADQGVPSPGCCPIGGPAGRYREPGARLPRQRDGTRCSGRIAATLASRGSEQQRLLSELLLNPHKHRAISYLRWACQDVSTILASDRTIPLLNPPLNTNGAC
jgi:hypothetical protein